VTVTSPARVRRHLLEIPAELVNNKNNRGTSRSSTWTYAAPDLIECDLNGASSKGRLREVGEALPEPALCQDTPQSLALVDIWSKPVPGLPTDRSSLSIIHYLYKRSYYSVLSFPFLLLIDGKWSFLSDLEIRTGRTGGGRRNYYFSQIRFCRSKLD
jgi:hypothetical protein